MCLQVKGELNQNDDEGGREVHVKTYVILQMLLENHD